jgi:FkbM family methyltransferase
LTFSVTKIQTAIELLANPRFFSRYRAGIIPYTFCRLNKPWFYNLNIDTLIDIGANIGRFSATFHALVPQGRIFAFEPLPHCYEQSVKLLANIPAAKVFNCGLGSSTSEMEMFASRFSPSSSLLQMGKTHIEAFPDSHDESTKVRVVIRKLDDVMQALPLGVNAMVKIDVQGFEKEVILGGPETLKKAKFVLVEVSYEELYQNQPLFQDINKMMVGLGFTYSGTMAQLQHPVDGRFLDADCLYVRSE